MFRQPLLFLTILGVLFSWRNDSPEWLVFQAIIIGFFATAVFRWSVHRLHLKWSWAFVPMLAITAWPAAQLALGGTVYPNATIAELLRWATYSAMFALAFW